MAIKGIAILTDHQIATATRSACDGGGLWLIVETSKSDNITKRWEFFYRSLDENNRSIYKDGPNKGMQGNIRVEQVSIGSLQKVSAKIARKIAEQCREWIKGIPGVIPPKDPKLMIRNEKEKNELSLYEDAQKLNKATMTVARLIDEDYIPFVLKPGTPEYFVHRRTKAARPSSRSNSARSRSQPQLLSSHPGYDLAAKNPNYCVRKKR